VLQDKKMTVEEAIDLGVGISSALQDLHKIKIIHRDLKPGNIIMQPLPDGKRRAVVVDFGVSRVMTDKDGDADEELTGITRADMAVGTIEYMAPEQILNSRAVTSASDIYAAGAILFRAAAGRHVFGNIASDAELAQKKLMSEAPQLKLERTDKLAAGLVTVVTRALRRKPADRYKSAEDLLKDLLPLRDLARAAAIELDSTTVDRRSIVDEVMAAAAAPAMGAPASGPIAAAEPVSSPSSSGMDARGAVASSPSVQGASLGAAAAPARRGGVPIAVMIAAVVVALAGGAVLGSGVLKRPAQGAPEAATATASAAPTANATATATANATASPTANATTTATASASAAVPIDTASASAAPSAYPVPADSDLPEAIPLPDPTPAKKLWGALPKGSAAGDATAAPKAAGTAAATAPSAKASAAPAAPPTPTNFNPSTL
jgi:eukaryotic-like serine/threonine-protein kinase